MTRKTALPMFLAMTIGLFVLVFVSGISTARAQDEETPAPSPAPESEELKRLKERNQILEQETKAAQFERDRAKAEKEKLDATFPKPTATPLEGKTEVDDGVKIESEMVAYYAMALAADKIKDDIRITRRLPVNGVAIYNDRDIKTLLGYVAITNQLRLMQDEYNKLIVAPTGFTPTANANVRTLGVAALPAIGTIATSVLGSFIDVIALFRTDTTVKGMSFSIEEAALVSEVFRALKDGYGPGVKLFYPAVVPPNLNTNKSFIILGEIQTLYLLKARAEEVITKIEENEKALKEAKDKIKALGERPQEIDEELAQINDDIKTWLACRFPGCAERVAQLRTRRAALVKESNGIEAALEKTKILKANLEAALDELYLEIMPDFAVTTEAEKAALRKLKKASLLRLKALNIQFDKLKDELIKVDGGTGINALTAYLQAENLRDALGCTQVGESGELRCENAYLLQLKVISAGGNNRVRRNLIRDVFKGADISHSGGAIVEYILYDLTDGASKASNTFTVYQSYKKAKDIPQLVNE